MSKRKKIDKKKLLIILIPIIMLLSVYLFYAIGIYSEEKNWLDYINARFDSFQYGCKVTDLAIVPNHFERDFSSKDYMAIEVQISFEDSSVPDIDAQKAAIAIRNIVQTYIDDCCSTSIDGRMNIELDINVDPIDPPFHKSKIGLSSKCVSFGNQYSDILNNHFFYDKKNINSLQLDSVYAKIPSLTEKELELFSDSKSMIVNVSNISDFSFLEKFSKLKYLSITDFEDEQIDECAKHLPDGCELYVNRFPLEKFRDPSFVREYYETHDNKPQKIY